MVEIFLHILRYGKALRKQIKPVIKIKNYFFVVKILMRAYKLEPAD